MNTNDVLARWKRVAAGERDPDLDQWLQHIAQGIVSNVFEAKFPRSARRADAAQKAVGWVDRLNPHAELDALAVADFTQGSSARAVADAAPLIVTTTGSFKKDMKRIEYARKKR